MITINIIGTGRLGKTLMRLIHPLENVTLQTNEHSPRDLSQLPSADLHFITVPDDKIAAVAAELCQHQHDTTLVHCSGSLPAKILNPDNRTDIETVSVHPAKSFTDPEQAAADFPGTLCTIEGDSKAVALVSELFTTLGARLYPINAQDKAAYHAANCIAANYLVTLADAACQQFVAAGLDPAIGKAMTEQLMQSVLDNLKNEVNCADALTGPIARGDIDTINNHLLALKPTLQDLYQQLAKQTLTLVDLDLDTTEVIKNKN